MRKFSESCEMRRGRVRRRKGEKSVIKKTTLVRPATIGSGAASSAGPPLSRATGSAKKCYQARYRLSKVFRSLAMRKQRTRRATFASTFVPASIDSALSADLKYQSTCIDSSQEARSVSEGVVVRSTRDGLANATGYRKRPAVPPESADPMESDSPGTTSPPQDERRNHVAN